MAKPTLEACMEKHRRGAEHLAQLDSEVSEYLGSEPKPHRTAGQFHPDRRKYVVVGEILKPMPEVWWGVLLGDGLHNLRSALDHLVWQLVLLNTGKDGSTESKFPIESSGQRYWSIAKNGKPSVRDRALKGVSDRHRAFIDALQPYRTKEEGKASQLANLRNWSNFDKHRLLNPALTAIDAFGENQLRLSSNADAGEIIGIDPAPFSPDGETEILAVEYSCPGDDPDVTMESKVAVNVGFGEPAVRVIDLPQLAVYVGEVIEAFADDF